MSSSFLGVSVYLLEWFLSIVGLPQGDFKTANLMLGKLPRVQPGLSSQRIDGHRKKTYRHCVRLNDVFFWRDSWSTVRLQPMVMVVCFLLHFVSNLGVYDMTTMESPKRQPGKPRIPAALAFSGYRSVCGGPCCPENSSGAGGENEISRPLTGSSWYSRNHKMTVDSLNLLFSDLLVGREFSSKLEVEDVWLLKG